MNGFSDEVLHQFNITILKRILTYYNLDTKGRKEVLIERILKYQKDKNEQNVSVRIKRILEASNEIR